MSSEGNKDRNVIDLPDSHESLTQRLVEEVNDLAEYLKLQFAQVDQKADAIKKKIDILKSKIERKEDFKALIDEYQAIVESIDALNDDLHNEVKQFIKAEFLKKPPEEKDITDYIEKNLKIPGTLIDVAGIDVAGIAKEIEAEQGREKKDKKPEQEKPQEKEEEARAMLEEALDTLNAISPKTPQQEWVIKAVGDAINASPDNAHDLKQQMKIEGYTKTEGVPVDELIKVLKDLHDSKTDSLVARLSNKEWSASFCESHFGKSWAEVEKDPKQNEALQKRLVYEAFLIERDYRGEGKSWDECMALARQVMQERKELVVPLKKEEVKEDEVGEKKGDAKVDNSEKILNEELVAKRQEFAKTEKEVRELNAECDRVHALAKRLGIVEPKKPELTPETAALVEKARGADCTGKEYAKAAAIQESHRAALVEWRGIIEGKIKEAADKMMTAAAEETEGVPSAEVFAIAHGVDATLKDHQGLDLLIATSGRTQEELQDAAAEILRREEEEKQRKFNERVPFTAREVQTGERKGEALGVKNKEVRDLMDPEKVKERFAQLIKEVTDLVLAREDWRGRVEFQGAKKGFEGAEHNYRRREEDIIAKIIQQVGPESNLPESARINEGQCAELYEAAKRWVQDQALIEMANTQRGQDLETGKQSKWKRNFKTVFNMGAHFGVSVGAFSLLGPFAALGVVGGLRAVEGVVRSQIDRKRINTWKEKHYEDAGKELQNALSFTIADFVEQRQREGKAPQSAEAYHKKFVSALKRENATLPEDEKLTNEEIQSRALRLSLYFEQDDVTKRRHNEAIASRSPQAQDGFRRGETAVWNWVRRQRWLPFKQERGRSLSFNTSPRDKAYAGATALGISTGFSLARIFGKEEGIGWLGAFGAVGAGAYGGFRVGGSIADKRVGKHSPERMTEQQLTSLESSMKKLSTEDLATKSGAEISTAMQPFVEALSKTQAQLEQLRNPLEYAKQIERFKELYAKVMHLKALGEFEKSDKFKTASKAGAYLAGDYGGYAAADRARMDTLDQRNRNTRLRWKIGGALVGGMFGYFAYKFGPTAARAAKEWAVGLFTDNAPPPPVDTAPDPIIKPDESIRSPEDIIPVAGAGSTSFTIEENGSIWKGTHDFLKGHGYDQARYQAEFNAGKTHLGSYNAWLNQETNEALIDWKQQGLGGAEIKDLVHKGDTLGFNKDEDGTWHLKGFEESSGKKAGFLSDEIVTKNTALDPKEGFRMADGVKMGETTSALDDVGRDYTLSNGKHITVFDADRDGFFEVNGKEMSADEFQKFMQEQGAFVETGPAQGSYEEIEKNIFGAKNLDEAIHNLKQTNVAGDDDKKILGLLEGRLRVWGYPGGIELRGVVANTVGDVVGIKGVFQGVELDITEGHELSPTDFTRLHDGANQMEKMFTQHSEWGLVKGPLVIHSFDSSISGVSVNMPGDVPDIPLKMSGDPLKVMSLPEGTKGPSGVLDILNKEVVGKTGEDLKNGFKNLDGEMDRQQVFRRVVKNHEALFDKPNPGESVKDVVDRLHDYIKGRPDAAYYLKDTDTINALKNEYPGTVVEDTKAVLDESLQIEVGNSKINQTPPDTSDTEETLTHTDDVATEEASSEKLDTGEVSENTQREYNLLANKVTTARIMVDRFLNPGSELDKDKFLSNFNIKHENDDIQFNDVKELENAVGMIKEKLQNVKLPTIDSSTLNIYKTNAIIKEIEKCQLAMREFTPQEHQILNDFLRIAEGQLTKK